MKVTSRLLGAAIAGCVLLALACSAQEPAAAPAQPPAATPVPATTAPAAPTPAPTPEAMSSAAQAEEDGAPRQPFGPPPKVDTNIASVDPADILFDTFQGGFIPLSEAKDGQIEYLRDAIKPIYEPQYGPVSAGEWLDDADIVIGYESDSGAFAYPLRLLDAHEIVNDLVDGVPVAVTYCPLCRSGVVYSRELDGQTLVFGNTSALYESDMVMYDHQTGSYWFQVLGEAVIGPLTGKRLRMLPSQTIPWGEWIALHGDTRVLRPPGDVPVGAYRDEGFAGLRYQDALNTGYFAFPVNNDKLDDRLRPGDLVYAVQVGEDHKAYALTADTDGVLNDRVGGRAIVVVARAAGPSASAYFSDVDGRTLSFRLGDGALKDEETGSTWDDAGRAVAGQLAGERLTPVPSRAAFWFSVAGALPDMELHAP